MSKPHLNGHHDHDDVRAFLEKWPAPPPDAWAKARLTQRLLAELPAPPRRPRPALSLRWAWLLARAQLRLVHPATWLASLLVMVVGTGVTLVIAVPSGNTLLLALLAPVVAALGVAFLYGLDADPPLELLFAAPVSPRVILLARLAVLYGFNLLLGIGCSVVLAASSSAISLWPLVLSWLAPMTFLSALAFLLSVLFFDPMVSALISLGLWIVQIARQMEVPVLLHLPDLLSADARPLLFAAAAALVAAALALVEREDRWAQ